MTGLLQSVAALALAAYVLVAARPREGRELLVNGSFEDGLASWIHLDMSGTLTLELDRKTKKDGKQALRIERGAGERVDFVKQFATLESDEGEVEFSIAYRVDREGEIRIQVFFFDAAGDDVGGFVEVARSGDTKKKWLRAEKTLPVPAGARSFGLNVWASAPGVAWIDEASAVHDVPERADEPAAAGGAFALANGGFDADLRGWDAVPFGSGSARAERDAKKRASGAASLRIERESVRLHPEDAWRALAPKAPRRRAKRATLALACAASGDARPSVHLQALAEGGAVLASARLDPPRAEEFARAELALELPPATAAVAVTLAVGGRGTVWFDDLVLETR